MNYHYTMRKDTFMKQCLHRGLARSTTLRQRRFSHWLRLVPWLTSLVVLLCIPAVGILAQDTGQKTIAILYFENNSVVDKDKLDPLKKGLADMLITEMSKIKSL